MKNLNPLRFAALSLAAWIVVAAVYSASARAAPAYVYCESAFGSVSIHKGRCPYGTKFIGVKG